MESEHHKTEAPDDDWVVYLPDAEMRAFERALLNMEMAQMEFRKLAEDMKEMRRRQIATN